MSKISSIPKSFKYAIDGIKTAIKNEPNFRVHLIIAAFAIFLAYYLNFEKFEWLFLLITISFVIILELVNTTLEAIVNLVSPKIKPQAKIAKDVSAAAVLIAAITAIFIGLFLFLPKILLR